MKNVLPTLLFAGSMLMTETSCATLPKNAELSRDLHRKIVSELKTPARSGSRVRIVTDEKHEVPDPTRPLLIDMPDGQKKYVIGFSGQNIMLVDSLERLVKGGTFPVDKVDLLNENGHP